MRQSFLVILILADQLIKAVVIHRGIYSLNSGIAFSLGEAGNYWWAVITLGLLVLVWQKFKWRWETGLILAGGSSNFLDRLIRGGVVDYGNFFNWTKINLADIFIIAGLAGLLYSFWYETAGDNL